MANIYEVILNLRLLNLYACMLCPFRIEYYHIVILAITLCGLKFFFFFLCVLCAKEALSSKLMLNQDSLQSSSNNSLHSNLVTKKTFKHLTLLYM